MDKKNIYGILLLFMASIFWGSAYLSMSISFNQGVGVFSLMTIRFLIGGGALVIFNLRELKIKNLEEFTICSFSGVTLFLMFLNMCLSLLYISPSKAGSIFSTYLISILIINRFLKKVKFSFLNIGYSLFLILGIFYLNKEDTFNLTLGLGEFCAFLSGFFFSGYLIYLEHNTHKISYKKLSIYQMLICGFISWFFIPFFGEESFQITLPVVLNFIYIGVIVTSLAYTLQNLAMNWVASDTASVILSFQSIFAVVIPMIFLKEPFTVNIFKGLFFMAVGLLLFQRNAKLQKKRTSIGSTAY